MNRNNDDKLWDERLERCGEILRELIRTEFKGKIRKKIRLYIRDIEGWTNAEADFSSSRDYYRIIVNKKYWSQSGFTEQELRDTLRHELLHLEMELGDKDPLFQMNASTRGISLNKDACWLCSQCRFPCKEEEKPQGCPLFKKKD